MAKVMMIGHANGDEKGGSSGGQSGDQTGREVCIQQWYSSGAGWNFVLRPKSLDLAEKMAAACEWICTSNLVGYDQGQRNTLYNELEKLNWNYKKLTTKCETDCSAFMGTCAKIAGSNVQRVYGNCCYTGNQEKLFMDTGDFIKLTDSKYLTSPNLLQRGDVLVRHNDKTGSGHTAMVLGWKDITANSNTQIPINNGSLTIAQVKEMQAYYGVKADGEWGSKSKAAAGGLSADDAWKKYQASKNPYPEPARELKYRAIGDDVKWVQHILYNHGYKLGSYESFVDGEIGPVTKAMIIMFQAKAGLKMDGEVGPKTIAALKKL